MNMARTRALHGVPAPAVPVVPAPVLVLCALASCAGPYALKPVNSYLADARDLRTVRRIMVLPFGEAAGVCADLEHLRSAFVGELAKLRRFEIVPLPAAAPEDDVLNRGLATGRLSTEAVVELCERYKLDGVLLGRVTSWRPYKPPHLGLHVQLVSVHSGSTVWAVDALFDSSDATTVNDLKHYAEAVQADTGDLHGWEMNLIAPTKFATYVAHRVVGTWVEG